MFEYYKCEHNDDGSIKHIQKDGVRYHILYYDTQGIHCTEKNVKLTEGN